MLLLEIFPINRAIINASKFKWEHTEKNIHRIIEHCTVCRNWINKHSK